MHSLRQGTDDSTVLPPDPPPSCAHVSIAAPAAHADPLNASVMPVWSTQRQTTKDEGCQADLYPRGSVPACVLHTADPPEGSGVAVTPLASSVQAALATNPADNTAQQKVCLVGWSPQRAEHSWPAAGQSCARRRPRWRLGQSNNAMQYTSLGALRIVTENTLYCAAGS